MKAHVNMMVFVHTLSREMLIYQRKFSDVFLYDIDF